MEPIPIHYDCDPGQDDAIALLYALGSPKIDVRSITVVGGNIDVFQCSRNALQILELANRFDIPVYIAAKGPLERPLISLPEVFGLSGMAGAEDLPEPKSKAITIDAATQFSSIVKERILVATGPLTNLALQIQTQSSFPNQIDHLYIMGGCPFPEPVRGRMGNYKIPGTEDYAEYNFVVDPEAAKIVFQASFKKITLIGLNVTRTLLYNKNIDAALREQNNIFTSRAADILSSLGEDDVEDYGHLRETPEDPVRAIHDVVAMAALDAPELFEFEEVPLYISADSNIAPIGQSLIDPVNFDHSHVRVAKTINKAAFIERMIENIRNIRCL